VDAKKIYVFTDFDLDGAASLLMLHWALGTKPGELQFKTVTVSTFRKEFLKWLESESINDYDNVYFLDLDTSTCIDLVDNKKSIIIDHHLSHVLAKENYKNATINIVETTSCAKLVYINFKEQVEINDKQKYLIALANDYDSYQFKLPETYNLNCLFSSTQKTLDKTRTHKFLERYYKGFEPFNYNESNIIKTYIDSRDHVIANLQIYSGRVNISKQDVVVTGTTGSRFINDVCDYLLKEWKSDIVFFLNLNNQHVSWRKKKECTIDLSKVSEMLCNGGGHQYAAGGKVTPQFMEFVKQLTLVEKNICPE
jgi:oligoribonuclease NrnB/cAMP/cGMP phosphodiesterase (DHH superfamily)